MTEQLAFLLSTDSDSDLSGGTYFHLRAHVVRLTDDGIRGLLDDDAPALADLQVSAQTHSGEAVGFTYGWSAEYRGAYAVDLDRAKAMVATLTKIRRRYDRQVDQLGYPADFGAYLLRVADALRIRTFLVWTRRPKGFDDPGEYRVMDGRTAAYWLDVQEREFHNPPATSKGA